MNKLATIFLCAAFAAAAACNSSPASEPSAGPEGESSAHKSAKAPAQPTAAKPTAEPQATKDAEEPKVTKADGANPRFQNMDGDAVAKEILTMLAAFSEAFEEGKDDCQLVAGKIAPLAEKYAGLMHRAEQFRDDAALEAKYRDEGTKIAKRYQAAAAKCGADPTVTPHLVRAGLLVDSK